MGATLNRRFGAASIALAVAATTVGVACSTVLEADGDGVVAGGGGGGPDGGVVADGSSSDGPSGDGPPSGSACTATSALCILSEGVSLQHISAHASFVYFADSGGKILKVPKLGGVTEEILGTSPAPSCLASSSSGVYWCSSSTVQRAPIGISTPSPSFVASPMRIQARMNFVAWTVRDSSQVFMSSGDLMNAQAFGTVAIAPVALAISDTHVYFAESGTSGRVMRIHRADGMGLLIVGQGADGGAQSADTFVDVAAIATSAFHVVWVDTKGVYRKLTTSDDAFASGRADRVDGTITDGVDVVTDDAKRNAYIFTRSGRLHVLPLDGGPAAERTDVGAACKVGRGMAHDDDPATTVDPYLYLACASSILRVMK